MDAATTYEVIFVGTGPREIRSYYGYRPADMVFILVLELLVAGTSHSAHVGCS